MKPRSSINSYRSRALSLLEVMASVLIMGSMVAAVLVTVGGSVRQTQFAARELTAAHLARELWVSWSLEESDLSLADAGIFENHPGWTWSRSVKVADAGQALQTKEVTLTLLRTLGDHAQTQWQRSFVWWIADKPHKNRKS